MRDLGTVGGIADRLAARGLPADGCGTADKPPSIPPSAITLTSDDYPKDLLRRNVRGVTSVELAVAADGKVEGSRIIASQPPTLFDSVTTIKLANVTLFPARRKDKPVACRGKVQTVRWQIPFRDDFSMPFTGSPTSDE